MQPPPLVSEYQLLINYCYGKVSVDETERILIGKPHKKENDASFINSGYLELFIRPTKELPTRL